MTLAERIDAFLEQRNLPIHQALDLLEEARDELKRLCRTDPAPKLYPDGPGFSPDGGRYWVKGDKMYFENGQILEIRPDSLIIGLPGFHENDYSAWSDEKRAEVYTEWLSSEARRQNGQREPGTVAGDREEDQEVRALPTARRGKPAASSQEIQASTKAGHDPKDDVNPPEGYEVHGG